LALPTHMRHSENAKTMGHDELFSWTLPSVSEHQSLGYSVPRFSASMHKFHSEGL